MHFSNGKPRWPSLRDTERHPTASTMTGLIACCLGIENKTKEYEDLRSSLHFYTTIPDYVSILDDYQIVSPKEEGKPVGQGDMMSADGTWKKDGSSKSQVHTRFVEDGVFYVLAGCDNAEFLRKIHYALLHPRWTPYIGMACCTPSDLLTTEDFIIKDLNEWEKEEEYVCI